MSQPKPDFYLSSTEHTTYSLPRACRIVSIIKDPHGSQGVRVVIDPPVIGQQYGLGGKDISELLFFPRFVGSTLPPKNEWPVDVYICRILSDLPLAQSKIAPTDVEMVAWAELYPTLEEAERTYKRNMSR